VLYGAQRTFIFSATGCRLYALCPDIAIAPDAERKKTEKPFQLDAAQVIAPRQ